MAAQQTPLPRPILMEQLPVSPKPAGLANQPQPLRNSDKTVDTRSHVPSIKTHLRVLDVSSHGARAFLKAIDYGSVPEEYLEVVIQLLYDDRCLVPGTRSVTLVARPMGGVAYTTGIDIDDDHKEIHISTEYIQAQNEDCISQEIRGVIVHELVHCVQGTGCGDAPVGLTEGIADWVRLNCGLAPPHWRRSAEGNWDAGYETTGYFLDYLEGRFGFGTVRRINERLRRDRYEHRKFWADLFHHSVFTLWEDYKKGLEKQQLDRFKDDPAKTVVEQQSSAEDDVLCNVIDRASLDHDNDNGRGSVPTSTDSILSSMTTPSGGASLLLMETQPSKPE